MKYCFLLNRKSNDPIKLLLIFLKISFRYIALVHARTHPPLFSPRHIKILSEPT